MNDWTERYWEKVEVRGTNECWRWKAYRAADGYGRLYYMSGRRVRAHRLAWELAYGPIPEGMCVCHACDNRGCVNPGHLFLGTVADNNRDMAEKGRSNRGAKRWSAKLTKQKVREIRRLYAGGRHTQKELGQQFGVSHQQVSSIVTREKWAWLQ